METYPAFFTPRDEEPNLSSFEEKSSEFDSLEIKKRENKNIYEKQSKCSVFYFFAKLYKGSVSKNKLQRFSSKEDYKLYKGLFTLCSYLKTKESYDRWVTRRVWGFRHQISKAKYL